MLLCIQLIKKQTSTKRPKDNFDTVGKSEHSYQQNNSYSGKHTAPKKAVLFM